jgi:4-hydroxy-4-methyl-2-oxoglutarate aldolase
LDTRIQPIQQDASICGPAVTVICGTGDNLMIHAAVECCQPGDVLVVTTNGEANCHGMIGELLVKSLIRQGVKGLVIDGGVRDTRQIRELDFPVWTTAVCCAGTTKKKAGWVNARRLRRRPVHPGDLNVADDDGVVVVRQGEIAQALEKSQAREKKETGTTAKIEAGQLGVDFYGFREVLAKLGVRYYETAAEAQGREK